CRGTWTTSSTNLAFPPAPPPSPVSPHFQNSGIYRTRRCLNEPSLAASRSGGFAEMRTIALPSSQRLRTRAALALFGVATVVPFGLSATPVAAQAAPTLSVNDVRVTEGNPGSPQQLAAFTVSLSAPQPAAISVKVDTASGVGTDAAIEGTDFTGVHTTRVIP